MRATAIFLLGLLITVAAACQSETSESPTLRPTYTLYPTFTPVSTPTPEPTTTPRPTYTPYPTDTPEPTAPLRPTYTPLPTETIVPTLTPTPVTPAVPTPIVLPSIVIPTITVPTITVPTIPVDVIVPTISVSAILNTPPIPELTEESEIIEVGDREFFSGLAWTRLEEGIELHVGGKHAAAIERYKQALTHHGKTSRVIENRIGLAYAAMGEYELAISHYSNAIRIEDNSVDRVNRSIAYHAEGGCNKAVEDAKSCSGLGTRVHIGISH